MIENVMARCKRDQETKARNRRNTCPRKTYRGAPATKQEPVESRSALFRRIWLEVKKKVKDDNGVGMYSWRVGMRRRQARRVMRNIARRAFRNMRQQAV